MKRSTIQASPKTDPASYFDFARVYWAAGDKEKALSNLKILLEHTAPADIAVVKAMIERSVEFSPLRENEEFKAVLATESKMSQSECTGGSDCNTCTLKNKCPSTTK